MVKDIDSNRRLDTQLSGETSGGNPYGVITFPFQSLDRELLQPGVVITGMRSRIDVEAVLVAVKEAMIRDHEPVIGEITDKTRIAGPTISHKMFLLMNRGVQPRESAIVAGASARILKVNPGEFKREGKGRNFELHDSIRLNVSVDQRVQFINGETTSVTMNHEYRFHVATSTNTGKGKHNVNNSVFVHDTHPNSNEVVLKALKNARPKGRFLTASERNELLWKKNGEIEEASERRRAARSARYMKVPGDWKKREEALDRLNKRRIENPMQAGTFGGQNPAKKRS